MDVETKGLISEIINHVFEKQNILETVDWLFEPYDEATTPKSLAVRNLVVENLAVGYFLGSLMSIASEIARRRKLEMKLENKFKKELEKTHGKDRAAKSLEERDRVVREMRAKGGRRIKCELTNEESEDIRNMLIPMIQRFREKTRKELAVRRISS